MKLTTTTTIVTVDGVMRGLGGPDEGVGQIPLNGALLHVDHRSPPSTPSTKRSTARRNRRHSTTNSPSACRPFGVIR
jgi:hypothetical protein